MADGAAGRGTTTVRLDPDAPVRVTDDPFTAVLGVACSAIRDQELGRDSTVAQLGSGLGGTQRAALALLADPSGLLAPDCLTPADPQRGTLLTEELERLRDLTTAELQDDLQRSFDGPVPAQWARIAAAPRRWMHELVAALETVADVVQPMWARQAGHRDFEAARIGRAAVNGVLDTLYGGWQLRGSVRDGALEFPFPDDTFYDRTGFGIVLSPLLAATDLSISNFDRQHDVWLAYPVPADPGLLGRDGLASLLTPIRAGVLRHLDRARSMTEIAVSAQVTPPAATYQVDLLVACGLVAKQREGQHVVVRRTARGSKLIDLYADAET